MQTLIRYLKDSSACMSLLQIVHLDLKSHNILLGRGGIAKIADVGLAKIMRRSQTRASATGTFDWAAPGMQPLLLQSCQCISSGTTICT